MSARALIDPTDHVKVCGRETSRGMILWEGDTVSGAKAEMTVRIHRDSYSRKRAEAVFADLFGKTQNILWVLGD